MAAPASSQSEKNAESSPSSASSAEDYYRNAGLLLLARKLALVDGPSISPSPSDQETQSISGSRTPGTENQPSPLWEKVQGDKIKLSFDSLPSGTAVPQLFYPAHDTSNNTESWWAVGHDQPTQEREAWKSLTSYGDSPETREPGVADAVSLVWLARRSPEQGVILLERNLTNYKILVSAFHVLNCRKAELRGEWQLQNRDRVHLLRPHSYELPESWTNQPRYELNDWQRLATYEMTETGEILYRSRVYRRLVIRRAATGRIRDESRAVYIDVVTGKRSARKDYDIVLYEAEEDYKRLALFFASEQARDWQPLATHRKTAPKYGISSCNLPPDVKGRCEEGQPAAPRKRDGDDQDGDQHASKRARKTMA